MEFNDWIAPRYHMPVLLRYTYSAKNANDIFFGIKVKVLSFDKKNANDIFFGIVLFATGSQMNIFCKML